MELNEHEKELLAEVLRREHTSMLDEMHHTDSFDYRQQLKEKHELLSQLRSKIETSILDSGVAA